VVSPWLRDTSIPGVDLVASSLAFGRAVERHLFEAKTSQTGNSDASGTRPHEGAEHQGDAASGSTESRSAIIEIEQQHHSDDRV
jgi:hypothetical protein